MAHNCAVRGLPPHSRQLTFSRLMQNRKSAKKCRLKKKAEFSDLKSEVDNIA